MHRITPQRSLIGLATALGLLALTGCAELGPAVPSVPSAAPTSAASEAPVEPPPTPSVAPSPTTPTTPDAPAQPIGVACDALIPIGPLYDLNPNLSVVPDPAPPAGTIAATQVAGLGVACDLVHNSNGAVLRVAAARPGSAAIAALRAAATGGYDLGIPGIESFAAGGALIAIRGDTAFSSEATDYFGPEDLEAALRIALG